jgi:hypothetical protein
MSREYPPARGGRSEVVSLGLTISRSVAGFYFEREIFHDQRLNPSEPRNAFPLHSLEHTTPKTRVEIRALREAGVS